MRWGLIALKRKPDHLKVKSQKPDLFVDSNLSRHFARPVRAEYREFIEWLGREGHLIVCRSLIKEYITAVRGATAPTTLAVIVERLQRVGRLRRITKEELTAFRFSKRVERRLQSNRADHDFIKLVLLSDRKLGLSEDRKFACDVNNFPGYDARVASTPSEINYRE